ncbi:tRNA (cytosine(72)-C(5))-methyltransferase NSUN6-like, partial [Saccoglossus kowalevskii]|uniref:Methyltransferase NSUN6-like n=1 Tax=Saccoglossus kowalevskii TaxID=10224 RepID=A0ABM0LW60_SACKO
MQSGDHVSVYADTDSLCRKGSIKKYDGIKVYVGNGVAQVSRSDIFTENDINSGVGIKMTEPLYSAPSLNAVLPDCMFLQNLPSIVVGHVMSPQSGDIVLDMCAAPGGKTTHLSSLMNDKGVVIAIDRAQSKVSRIDLNICKLNLHCIKTFAYDSTRLFSPDVPVIDADSLGKPPYPAETFDKILLDGPCSALGQRPQLISTASLKEVQSYPSLQRKIFAN